MTISRIVPRAHTLRIGESERERVRVGVIESNNELLFPLQPAQKTSSSSSRRRRKKVSWTRASTTDVVLLLLLLLLLANELPPLSTVVHQCTLTIYGSFLFIVRDSPCRFFFFACLFDSSPFLEAKKKERKGAPQNRILFKFSRRAECIFSPLLLLYFPDHRCH